MSDFIAIPKKSGLDTGAGIQRWDKVGFGFSGQAFRLKPENDNLIKGMVCFVAPTSRDSSQ